MTRVSWIWLPLVGALGCGVTPAPSSTTQARDVSSALAAITPSASDKAAPSPSVGSAPASTALDAVFHGFEEALPKPGHMEDGNGFSMRCAHGGATLGLLENTAARVPLDGDASLPALVRWARHEDPCIRDIAMHALVRELSFDKNQLVEPPMHEVDQILYRSILASAMNRLAKDGAPLDPIVVAGLDLAITDADFAPLLAGKWEENRGERSFQLVLTVEPKKLAFTQIDVPPNPAFPDTTWTVPIARVKLDARRAFLVEGASRTANTTGFVGEAQKPDAPFVIVPVGGGVLWFDQGFGSLVKLHRAK